MGRVSGIRLQDTHRKKNMSNNSQLQVPGTTVQEFCDHGIRKTLLGTGTPDTRKVKDEPEAEF